MADQPYTSFADYLKRNQGAPSAPPPRKIDLSQLKTSYGKGGSGIPQDPLSWLVDMISRPLYAMTESIDSSLETGPDAVAAKKKLDETGDVMGYVGDTVGALGKRLSAPVRGLFSTHDDDKRLTHELIEKGTDTYGPAFDENYVDEQDNVNPVLKGILGFVGDVALDPLNAVPGWAIAKGLSKIGSGAKALGSAGKGVADTARAAKASRTPVEEVLETAGVRAAPESTVAGNIDIPTSTPRAIDEILKAASPPPAAKVADVPAPTALGELMRRSPKLDDAKAALKELSTLPKKARATKKAPLPRDGGPDLSKLPPIQEWMKKEIIDNPTAPQVTVGRETLTMVEAARMLGDDTVDAATRQSIKDQLEVGYEMWTEGIIPKLPKLPAPKDLSSTKPQTLRAQFLAKVSDEDVSARLEKALGSGVVSYLKSSNMGDPRFEKTLKDLSGLLDDAGLLDDFDLGSKISPSVRLLKHLGIDNPRGVQAARADYIKAPGTPPPGDIETVLSRIREGGDSVSRQAAEDLEEVLPGFIERNFGKGLDEYGFITDKGHLKTAEGFGKGKGRRLREINTHAQMELHSKLAVRVAKRIDDPPTGVKKLYGPQRAAEFEKQMKAAEEMAREVLGAQGIPFHIDEIIDGVSVQVPLSFNEVYDAVSAVSPEAAHYVRMIHYNGDTAVPVSRFMEAAVRAVNEVDPVVPLLEKTTRYGTEESVSNFLAAGKERWGLYGSKPIASNQRNVDKWGPTKAEPGARYVKTVYPKGHSRAGQNKSFRIEYSSSIAREIIADAFEQAAPALRALAESNAAAYRALFEGEVFVATAESVARLNAIAAEGKIGAALTALASPGKVVKEVAAEAQVMGTSAAATAAVVATATKEVSLAAQTAEKIATEATKGGRKGALKGAPEARKAQGDQFKAAQDENLAVEDAVKAEQPISADSLPEYDFSMKHTGDINGQKLSILDPLKKVFIADEGMRGVPGLDLYRIKHSVGIVEKMYHGSKVQSLRNLQQRYGAPLPGSKVSPLQSAFKSLQARTPPVGNPQAMEVYRELERHMDDIMGNGGVFDNVFFRNNVGVQYINDIFSDYKVLGPDVSGSKAIFFDIDAGERFVKEAAKLGNDIDVLTAVESQWRQWDVKDVTDFMSKLHLAASRMAGDVATAQSFEKMALREGLASTTPQKGLVKIVASGDSRLVRLLPENLYVDPEAASALHRLDEVMRASLSIDGEIGKFIKGVFDPIQNAWKVSVTILRPGHHPRNFFGDESMTFFAEGMQGQLKSAKDAFKVMAVRNDVEGVDLIKALYSLDVHDLPTSGTVISTGKYGDITTDGIVNAMVKEGNLPSAYITEDVYIDRALGQGPSRLQKTLDVLTFKDKAPQKIATSVSQARDHYSRIKHFIQFVDKAQRTGEYKNVDELMKAAGKQIMKWHPDVSLLSTSEHKYLRRIFPFYNWFRGAVPAVAGAALINPARVNALNKASYNLAVSMGVNPESLHDPFPQDQMFPSFLTEQMEGPQFRMPDGTYIRVNPGFASWDIGSMLFGAPTVGEGIVRGLAGSTSPLIRMPAEMLSGGSWGTGARINDMSDYLDASIPGVNYLSNITGTSFTGTLANLGTPDPQYQHARGNKGPADQALSFVNYLSGLGIQDYSKPNYINFAEIEKRNREGAQRGF